MRCMVCIYISVNKFMDYALKDNTLTCLQIWQILQVMWGCNLSLLIPLDPPLFPLVSGWSCVKHNILFPFKVKGIYCLKGRHALALFTLGSKDTEGQGVEPAVIAKFRRISLRFRGMLYLLQMKILFQVGKATQACTYSSFLYLTLT